MTTDKRIQELSRRIDANLEAIHNVVNAVMPPNVPVDKRIEGESMRGGGTHVDDWERGYAKGYARALEQVLSLTEGTPVHLTVDCIVDKLRREVLHDTL